MGIQGLLPLLKSIQQPTHLRKFAGQVIGVDAYGWLHRGTVSCAIELAQQKPTRKHIDFALNRVRMLIHFGVKPYLVFDGDYLPSKAHTEADRAARRKESSKLGLDLLAKGRTTQAQQELQKAVDVTPSMARELIEELKLLNVPYVVAPYEADAQLAYLEKQGIISGVLSEDSDLLVFGVRCLLTKLDQYGECVLINRSNFTSCREVSLVNWSDKEFRMMAIMSGCDYLPGIDKMGLKTAYRLVRKHKAIERIVRTIQFDGKMKVPPGYLEAFTNAEKTFLYQWAYCPVAKALVNLNDVPDGLDVAQMPFIGSFVEPAIATGVAKGDLDPSTKEQLRIGSMFKQPHRNRTVVQTPSEKPGKPISEFFKLKRTPLAELDPNSFTPSPSQQRLLENHQRLSWSATQVSTHGAEGPHPATVTQLPQSAPQVGRQLASVTPGRTQTSVGKRQRLCSETAIAEDMSGTVGLKAATSRYFTRDPSLPSPLIRKAQSRRRQDDFELWSDDSVVDALSTLDGAPADNNNNNNNNNEMPSPKRLKKLDIFIDKGDQSDRSPLSVQEDSATPERVKTSNRAASTPTLFQNTTPRKSATIFSQSIDAEYVAFKELYGPSHGSHDTPQADRPNFDSSITALRPPLQQKSGNKPITMRPNGISGTKLVDIALPIQAQEQGETGVVDNVVDDHGGVVSEVRPAAELVAFGETRGSEDLLVPDSPEVSPTNRKARAQLDLGQYAFTG